MSGGVPAGELLPCPFCGKDEYLSNGGTACHFAVVCIGCDSEGPWIEYDQSQQGDFERAVAEAHTAWNTRATPTPPIEGRDADAERVASSYAKACDLGTEYHPTEWEKELIEDGIRQYVKTLTPTETMINAARKAITDRYYSGGNVVQITPIKPREMAELVLRAALQALGERG